MCTPELHVCYALLWGAQYWTGQYPSDTGDEAKALKGAGEEAEHRSLGGDAPERRSGSCTWEMRIKRCVVVPAHKEPCLLFGGNTGGGAKPTHTPSREFSKLFKEEQASE